MNRDFIVRMAIAVVGVAIGVWVAFEYVGVYASIDHCPQSEFACGSPNIRNIIPAVAGGMVAISVIGPLLYGYEKYGETA